MRRRGLIIPFPRRRESPEAGDERELVEVYRCDQAEAVVVKGLLEADGIPTLFRSRLAHSVHPFSVGSQGEVVILVPRADATRARLLLTHAVPPRPLPESGGS